MKKYNTIFTRAEYMKQGFKPNELRAIRMHDTLFNKCVDNTITEREEKLMYKLSERLGL